jgi:hypothetical protein
MSRDQNTTVIQPPTMPPKARQNSRNLIEKEGRILLVLSALKKKNKEIATIRDTAKTF